MTLVTADLPAVEEDVHFITDLLLCRRFKQGVSCSVIDNFDVTDRNLALSTRLHIHYTVNHTFPAIIFLTLPIFLASSSSPIEFVLNAMAMLFVITLDDIPDDKQVEFELISASAQGSAAEVRGEETRSRTFPVPANTNG